MSCRGAGLVLGLSLLAGSGGTAECAGAALELIEVRLVAKAGGVPFSFADGKTFELERFPFLQRKHFARVEARPTSNRNNPGLWQVEVVHNARGRAAYVAKGEADRDRSYCVVVGRTIDHCAAFPPPQKGFYERGQLLMDRTEPEARRLRASLEAAIQDLASSDRATDRAARRSPRDLLEALYRRAVKEQSPDWLGGEEREAFLSRDLVALWARVDASKAAGNEDAVFSSDPVAATNGLELKGYRIAVKASGSNRVTAHVALTYKDSSERSSVDYELVKEDGRWRIAEIGKGVNSVGAGLRAFIAPPAPAGER